MQRRAFLRVLAAAAAAGATLRPRASAAQAADELYELPPFGNVSLLHITDVHAQLLRVRLWASKTVPLDSHAAREEAAALARFQLRSEDPRIDGGFTFGAKNGEIIPHVNPVSTAFALQALHMWQTRSLPPLESLI